MKTQLLKVNEDSIALGAKLIREGELVGFPTETVYGLGANALDAEAVVKIFEAKGRPQDNPLITHVSCVEEIPPLGFLPARPFRGAALGGLFILFRSLI